MTSPLGYIWRHEVMMNEAAAANSDDPTKDEVSPDLFLLLSSVEEKLNTLQSNSNASTQDQALLNDVRQTILYARQSVINGSIHYQKSEIAGDVTTSGDTSPQKESEHALHDSQAALTLLSEVAGELLRGADPPSLLDGIHARLASQFGVEIYIYHQFIEETNRLELSSSTGLQHEVGEKLGEMGFCQAMCGDDAHTCQGLVLEEAQGYASPKTAYIRSLGINAYACFPLYVQGRLVGVLSFGSRQLPRFDKTLMQLIRIICDLVADAIDRKRAERTLAESERHLRNVLDNLFAFVGVLTPEGVLLEANRAPLEAAGISFDDVYGKRFEETYWWNYSPQIKAKIRRAIELSTSGQPQRFDIDAMMASGRFMTIDFMIAPLFDALGKVKYLIPSGVDITERKRTERALRESEERFRHLADAMPQLVWTAGADGTVDYYNERVHEFHGFQRSLDGSWQWSPSLHPEDLERTVEAWQRAVEFGETYQIEHRARMADGSYRWHLSRAFPACDETGQIIRWYGTATDIHENKLAEKALAEAYNELHTLNAGLEERIQERTQELDEVQHKLVDGIEAERMQLAREIHDGPIQELYTLFYRVAGIEASQTPARINEELKDVQEEILQVNNTMRAISQGLLPPLLSHFGLVKTIRSHIDTIEQSHPGFKVQLDLHPESIAPDHRVRLVLFRIYQTSITNIIRHAQANQVTIRYYMQENNYFLEIQDDGVGFKPPGSWMSLAQKGHMGLVSARERAQSVGGTLEIQSKPGEGTLVQVRVPCA
jgi:PAS domain S-box-containing protein